MSESLLKIEDLHAWYGESHVLHGVDMHIDEGETVTLLGRNGAGKSSILRAVLGIIRKRRGNACFRGIDLMKTPMHQIAYLGIGYVPEERGIFASLDVSENLTLPPQVKAGGYTLDQIYELFPNLYERRHSQGTKLSGGEQQMLAIARVLRTGASFLILDEPTEGLAPVIVQRIGEVIRELKARGMTILLVEQNFRFARRVADRYYVLEDGKLAATFSSAELPERMEFLQRTLGLAGRGDRRSVPLPTPAGN
jgi:branched-chain amino acid transport system ATP-binding protein